jgi:DNA helicase IV
VLAKSISGQAVIDWLATRIVEIERFTRKLPSIAILVNEEAEVQILANALNDALLKNNIRVVACPGGQVVGRENDVRVFDVQHIKGLEFEAVFFVGVDELAASQPGLFDKYLYVGATRAATYLGITCTGAELPNRIAPLETAFGPTFG